MRYSVSSTYIDRYHLQPNPLGVPAEVADERLPFQALHPPARVAVAVQR